MLYSVVTFQIFKTAAGGRSWNENRFVHETFELVGMEHDKVFNMGMILKR